MSDTTVLNLSSDVSHAVIHSAMTDPANIPIINGRRTLLIGLGSTGAKVCNQILERILWTYDAPDNIPWLRCIVLETAPLPAERLVNEHARVRHLTINRNDYANLIANPHNYDPTLGFASWNIPRLLSGQDAITDGANNTRILGRLALLFPSNFTQIQTEIRNALDDLKKRTPQEAAEAYERGTGIKSQVSLPNDIHVYVIGTLCGGTASGCFIDMGYLLQSLQGYQLHTTGLFMLPATSESNPLFLANAYAALVELNHFSSDRTRYKVQYATSPNVPWEAPLGSRPYQNFYLLQTRGATDTEYAKLITATADYIYSDVVGSTALTRDAARTNIAQLFIQRDYWGATQKFYTFGLSAIEFPFTKVAKACAVRLTRRGLQELATGAALLESERSALLAQMPLLNRENLVKSLLARPDGGLEATMHQALSNAAPEALNSDTALALVREQINAAFDGATPSPLPSLPPRIVPQTIEDNARTLGVTLQDSIKSTCKSLLTGDGKAASRGIPTLLSLLDAIEAALNASKSSSGTGSAGDAVTGLNAAADEAQAKANECRRDFWLGLVWQKPQAIRRYVNEYLDIGRELVSQRLRMECTPTCDRLIAEALTTVQTLRQRLVNPDCGFQVEVQSLIQSMTDLYDRTNVASGTRVDGWSRTTNGVELFDNKTVEQEYQTCLRETASELKLTGSPEDIERQMAAKTVETYLTACAAALFAPQQEQRRFDADGFRKLPEFHDNQLLALSRAARRFFGPLKRRSILDRLLTHPDLTNLLISINGASWLFLDWTKGHPRYVDHPNKSYGFVFYNQQDANAARFKRQLEVANILDGETAAEHITDPNQVLILREQGAFSMGTVTNLKDEQFSQWRNAYENTTTIESYHARGDIKRGQWVGWTRADEEARVRIRNIFLVGIAVGVIEFRSATEYRFSYPPQSPADPGFLTLSNNLDEAAREILDRGKDRDIELAINRKRSAVGAPEMVAMLDRFIKGSDNKFREGEERLSSMDMEVYLVDYIRNDVELLAIYHSQAFYPNQVDLSYIRKDANGQDAYFCPNCNNMLGYNSEALYTRKTRDGKTIRVKECSYCARPL